MFKKVLNHWSRIPWWPMCHNFPFISIWDCGRNEFFPNYVLFVLGMGRGADATLTNLFNPTLGRDASHPCLISTWPKKGCTIVCVITHQLLGSFPKRTIPNWGKIRSSQRDVSLFYPIKPHAYWFSFWT